MAIPEEFKHRVYRTNLSTLSISNHENMRKCITEWPGAEIDVLYEGLIPTIVIVFETAEDCLAFTLTHSTLYGKK